MHQSAKPPVRRAATIAVTVAATTVASVIGIGTAASADPAVTATPSASASATPGTPTGTPTAPATAAPTPTVAPATTAPAAATPAATVTPAATASPTPTATPGDGSDLAFTEPSTKEAPLALSATVGTPFSHTFTTTGGNGTVGYAIQDAPSSDYTVNVETGVLSGTPTTAGTFDFEVVALSGSTQVTEYVRLTVVPSPLVFSEPSTASAPIELTATAGTPVSHTFRATGGPDTTAYAIQDSPTQDLTVNVETGVLAGTLTEAGTYSFQVVALSGTATATAYVRLTVTPAAPVGVTSIVTGDRVGGPAWTIAPNGAITRYDPATGGSQVVRSIPVDQGASLLVAGLAVDRFGNRTTPWAADGVPRSTVTSSVASDVVTWLPDRFTSRVTFPHASDHRLTVSEGGVSTSFTVAVRPTAAPASAVSHTTTGAAGTSSGTLAYTGADETTPIAWALGLLAAGAALLLRRFRRRHG